MSETPTARLERRSRTSYVWIIPVLCLFMVSAFLYGHYQRRGPEITIHFPNADGIVPAKTQIKYLGVTVGKVTDLEVEAASQTVRVTARLDRQAESLAKGGTIFVMIKPQVSFQGVEGLTTIFSGATLDLRPGEGAPATEFPGYSSSQELARSEPGLEIVLTTPHNGAVSPGVGVFYRGMRVGEVTAVNMSSTGQNVVVKAKIDYKYDQFVRDNTKFWDSGGVDAKVGLFGAKIRVDSMQSLWNGGIAFATPDQPGKPVNSGATFVLEPRADPAWDHWSPKL